MSTLQNTPKRIGSNKKKAITYSLALVKTLEFQDKIIQIGIKKDVSNNKHSDKPSTAKDAKEFNEKIQCDSNCIWYNEMVGSNEKSNSIDKLNINNDQNSENFCISFFDPTFAIRSIINAPKNGRKVSINNISRFNGLEPLLFD